MLKAKIWLSSKYFRNKNTDKLHKFYCTKLRTSTHLKCLYFLENNNFFNNKSDTPLSRQNPSRVHSSSTRFGPTFLWHADHPSTPLALSDVGTPYVVALSSVVCLLEDASNLAATHQITSLKSDRLRRWTRLQQVRSSNLKNRACHYLLLLGTLLFPT